MIKLDKYYVFHVRFYPVVLGVGCYVLLHSVPIAVRLFQ